MCVSSYEKSGSFLFLGQYTLLCLIGPPEIQLTLFVPRLCTCDVLECIHLRFLRLETLHSHLTTNRPLPHLVPANVSTISFSYFTQSVLLIKILYKTCYTTKTNYYTTEELLTVLSSKNS